MNNENALKNLVDTVDCIEMSEKRCFLIDGTLLGYVRENDFISHDLDLDLGVYMEEWEATDFIAFQSLMEEKDFTLHHTFGEWGRHFEASFKRDDIKIDLFFYYKADELISVKCKNDEETNKLKKQILKNRDFIKKSLNEEVKCFEEIHKRRFTAYLNGGRTMPDDILTYEYEADLIENLKEIEFKGHKFMIPAEPEKVLVAKYGEDWKTPKTSWRWDFDPKNLISQGKYL